MARSLSQRLTRAVTRTYARCFLRSLRHIDPRAFHAVNGLYSPPGGPSGPVLRLGLIGDSTALGLGVAGPEQTPGRLLARQLAAATGRPVQLGVYARAGAGTKALAPKVEQALRHGLDAVVVMTGANDTLMPVPLRRPAAELGRYVKRLRAEEAAVVVAVSPDSGAGGAIPDPVGRLLTGRSKRLGRLQGGAVLGHGARIVSFADPRFRSERDRLVGADGFHPSAEGYARQCDRLLSALLAEVAGPTYHGLVRDDLVREDLAHPGEDGDGTREPGEVLSVRAAARRVARTPDTSAALSARTPGRAVLRTLTPGVLRQARRPAVRPAAAAEVSPRS
ncbi:SGNH/GDSL hydrolase family protein [Streptomyces monticola]|uniref:SGNH/GDSL hydrolase family protein n=1 Tax=Streptomyces monticola TaxID=2666263 RepID=A0ABW2JX21_9ACTN